MIFLCQALPDRSACAVAWVLCRRICCPTTILMGEHGFSRARLSHPQLSAVPPHPRELTDSSGRFSRSRVKSPLGALPALCVSGELAMLHILSLSPLLFFFDGLRSFPPSSKTFHLVSPQLSGFPEKAFLPFLHPPEATVFSR